MQKLRVNGKKIEVYDSPSEMPMSNFNAFNKYLSIESGVGSTLPDVANRLARIKAYIDKDKENAIKEIDNVYQGMHFIMSKYSVSHRAFACTVKSIGGKEVGDPTDSNIEQICKELNTIKYGVLQSTIGIVKKNFKKSLRYFTRHISRILPKKSMLIY